MLRSLHVFFGSLALSLAGCDISIPIDDIAVDVDAENNDGGCNTCNDPCDDGTCEDTDNGCPDQDNDGSCDAEDCDDTRSDIYPDAPETVGNCIDENCDGMVGDDCPGEDDETEDACEPWESRISGTYVGVIGATDFEVSYERYDSVVNGGGIDDVMADINGQPTWFVDLSIPGQVSFWSTRCVDDSDWEFISVEYTLGGERGWGVEWTDEVGSFLQQYGALYAYHDAEAALVSEAYNGKTPFDPNNKGDGGEFELVNANP